MVVIFATVALSLYNIRFVRPNADDYTYTVFTHGKTIAQFITHEYDRWTGRFTSQFWYSIAYRLFGPHAEQLSHPNYWVWPVIVILTLIASLYRYACFLCKRNRKLVDNRVVTPLYLTATIVFLYMLSAHVGVVWYNISMSVVYQLGGIHILLHMVLLCGVVHSMYCVKGRRWQWWQFPALGILAISAFSTSGYNESLALMSIIFYGVGLLWSLLHHRKSAPFWITVVVMAIAGGVVSYLAPGNRVRIAGATPTNVEYYGSLFALGSNFIFQLLYGVVRFLGVLGTALFVLSRLPFTKQYLSLYTRLFDRFIQSSKTSFRRIIILAYPALIVAALLPTIYGNGGVGPPRLHTIIQFCLIISFGLFWASVRSTTVYQRLHNRVSEFRVRRGWQTSVVAIGYGMVALIVSVNIAMQFDSFRDRLPIPRQLPARLERLFLATVYNTFQDALYIGPQYKQASIALNTALRRAPADAELVVPPLCPLAKSLISYDERLSADANGYPNGSLAYAFGIRVLRLDSNRYCYNRNRLVRR